MIPPGASPGTFVPSFISAASATEAWVSGNGGIYHTTDGTNWTSQYTSGVNRIWVSNGDGWAITTNGHILGTVDSGANWTLLSSPTTSGAADLGRVLLLSVGDSRRINSVPDPRRHHLDVEHLFVKQSLRGLDWRQQHRGRRRFDPHVGLGDAGVFLLEFRDQSPEHKPLEDALPRHSPRRILLST